MSPVKINGRHGGLKRAKSRGCQKPECADYTPEALNNAPKCASLKAWNPWSVREVLSFAINIWLRLRAETEGWHHVPPHPPQCKHFKALKQPAAANGDFSSQWNILQEDVKTKEAIKKRGPRSCAAWGNRNYKWEEGNVRGARCARGKLILLQSEGGN